MPHRALRKFTLREVLKLLPEEAFPTCERQILTTMSSRDAPLSLKRMAQEVLNLCSAGFKPYEAINMKQGYLYITFHPKNVDLARTYWVRDGDCHVTIFRYWIKAIRGDPEYNPFDNLKIIDSIASIGKLEKP